MSHQEDLLWCESNRKGDWVMKRTYLLLNCLAIAAVLSACGGGGGSSDALSATGPIKIWYSDNAQEIAWGKATVEAWNQDHPKEKVTG